VVGLHKNKSGRFSPFVWVEMPAQVSFHFRAA
jgi:hypothetical protein